MTDLTIILLATLATSWVIIVGLLIKLHRYEAAEAKTHAQRIAAGKKGRATQTARALAKKAAGQ